MRGAYLVSAHFHISTPISQSMFLSGQARPDGLEDTMLLLELWLEKKTSICQKKCLNSKKVHLLIIVCSFHMYSFTHIVISVADYWLLKIYFTTHKDLKTLYHDL